MTISEVAKETKEKIKLMSLPCPYGDCNGQVSARVICGDDENSLKIQWFAIYKDIARASCNVCKQWVQIRIVNNFIMMVKIQP